MNESLRVWAASCNLNESSSLCTVHPLSAKYNDGNATKTCLIQSHLCYNCDI